MINGYGSDLTRPCMYFKKGETYDTCKICTSACDDEYACSLRQTADELKASKEKAYARLRTMDGQKAWWISQKYYNGKRPWEVTKC